MEILTVCTGNICRSPLAALVLRTRLADLDVTVESAGVRGIDSAPMTPEAIELATQCSVTKMDAEAHRSRYLTEHMLVGPDLILTMTRDHRREVAELAPTRLRSIFTVREFARLAASLDDETIVSASRVTPPASAGSRLRAAAAAVAAQRGLIPTSTPEDDDVIDPYRRGWDVYQRSSAELLPALAQVERVVRVSQK